VSLNPPYLANPQRKPEEEAIVPDFDDSVVMSGKYQARPDREDSENLKIGFYRLS
jgi:hypothetical protein